MPFIEKHGGRYLTKAGTHEMLEGKKPSRVVIVEFPSKQAIKDWYNDPGDRPLIPTACRNAQRDAGGGGPVKPWEDPRIARGMTAQLAKRRERITAGERPLGWKVGLGAPATMERLKLQGPVVGFLMQRALLLSGSTVSLQGWAKPVAEPEIAVRMMRDLAGGATADAAASAVKQIFPAIELADLDPAPTPDNIDAVLEGDIYQRHVILCGNTRAGARPPASPRA